MDHHRHTGSRRDTGAKGEAIAAVWLEERGYVIIERNWRHKRNEIDIIACKANRLHIIEVKTRTTPYFGLPEEHITRGKMNALKQAAIAYQAHSHQWTYLQFDVLAICMYPQQPVDYYLIEDVFF